MFTKSGLAPDFVSEGFKRAVILFSVVVRNNFSELVYREFPQLPSIFKEKANKIHENVSVNLWHDLFNAETVVEALNSIQELPEHLRKFKQLLPEETSVHHCVLFYLMTYSEGQKKELLKVCKILPTRLAKTNITEFYKSNRNFDRATIRTLFHIIAQKN